MLAGQRQEGPGPCGARVRRVASTRAKRTPLFSLGYGLQNAHFNAERRLLLLNFPSRPAVNGRNLTAAWWVRANVSERSRLESDFLGFFELPQHPLRAV